MITKAINRTLRAPARFAAYRRWLRRARSRSLAIVMYHGVTSIPLPIAHWCQMAAVEFEEQMRFLAHEYVVLPLPEVLRRLRNRKPLPERVACITFDDGFRNVCTTAYPILQRHHLPATVFVVTSLIGTGSPAWPELIYLAVARTSQSSIDFDGRAWPLQTAEHRAIAFACFTARLKTVENSRREQQLTELLAGLGAPSHIEPDSPLATMDWTEIQALSDGGLVTFGSHTHTHPILSRCTEETQRDELRVSRELLLDRLGTADLFAYPNGTRADFAGATKRLLHQLGYICGVSSIPGLNTRTADVYELRRVNVGADMRWPQFEMAMAGI